MEMKKIVFFTGAGMSAESGISTFRDSDGLWNNHRVEDVATPEGFARDPHMVLEFYNVRRREMLRSEPHEGHLLIAALEQYFDVCVITQNVDNLHERAGTSHVIHLHGELMKSQSTGDDALVYDILAESPDILLGDKAEDGCQLRPFIVWFGESVPKMEEAIAQVEIADVFVVVGTSLQVYPAAGLLAYVGAARPIYVIDPQPVCCNIGREVTFIQKRASDGMKHLVDVLRAKEGKIP